MKNKIQNWTIGVLTHTKTSGNKLDGSDARYSKGVPVIITNLKANNPSDLILIRLAKFKRSDLMITKILFKTLNPKILFSDLPESFRGSKENPGEEFWDMRGPLDKRTYPGDDAG